MEKVFIFGHKNPDTDSVTSAIALEYLKRATGVNAEARVLGMLTEETKYILNRFKIRYPKYLQDVKLQVRDIMYHKELMIDKTKSIEDLHLFLEEHNITGVPIVDSNRNFISIITSKMTLKECFKKDDGSVYSSYSNILNSLKGEKVLEFDSEIKGQSLIFSDDNIEVNSDSILIVEKKELINKIIDKDVKLIITLFDLDDELLKRALNSRTNIIKSSLDLYETKKKLKFSNYISTILTAERSHIVYETDYYDDFQKLSTTLGHNNYPVVNSNNKCLGLLRLTDIKNKNRKKVILVDHNESNQSITGLDEAEILEIIDHHKIGDLSTKNPINFRSMTVGSTNTILYVLFKESRISIPSDIASIMLGGIITDTLALTSPTTTDFDREVVKNLEELSGLDYKEFAYDIFNASVKIDEKNEYELVKEDLKTFDIENKIYKIAQITLLDASKFLQKKDKLITVLNKIKEDTESEFVLLFVTDILRGGSYLLFNEGDRTLNHLERSFNRNIFEGVFLENIVSRKLQIVPLLIENY